MKTINLQEWQKSKNKEEIFATIDSIEVFDNDILKQGFKSIYEIIFSIFEMENENLQTVQTLSETVKEIGETVVNLSNNQTDIIKGWEQILGIIESK